MSLDERRGPPRNPGTPRREHVTALALLLLTATMPALGYGADATYARNEGFLLDLWHSWHGENEEIPPWDRAAIQQSARYVTEAGVDLQYVRSADDAGGGRAFHYLEVWSWNSGPAELVLGVEEVECSKIPISAGYNLWSSGNVQVDVPEGWHFARTTVGLFGQHERGTFFGPSCTFAGYGEPQAGFSFVLGSALFQYES